MKFVSQCEKRVLLKIVIFDEKRMLERLFGYLKKPLFYFE